VNDDDNNGRSLAAVLADIKEELKEFVATRLTLLKSELGEKAQTVRVVVPLALVAALLLGTAFLLFTIALVALVFALLPDTAFRWCLAFLCIAILWSIAGAIIAYRAKREFQMQGVVPRKTIEVLKGDKLWIQSEVHQI
jgi:uncharacterized membrane protein YqjE